MLEQVLAAFLGSLAAAIVVILAGYGWICLGASDLPKPDHRSDDERRHAGEHFKGGKHA